MAVEQDLDLFHSTFTARITEKDVVSEIIVSDGSSFIKWYNRMRASCARTCVRSGSASRKTDFWTVDPRSRSPNKLYLCLYSYAEYRFPRCGGQHTDPFGFLWLYTIRFVAEFLAHADPRAMRERAGSI